MTRCQNGSRPALGLAMLLLGAWALCLAPAAKAQQAADSGRKARQAADRERAMVQPVLWQQQRGTAQRGPAPQARPAQGRPARGRPAPPLPPQMLERLKNLPPDEQERVLENNRRFQQLPPAQQEQLRQRLRELQEMSPEQRELIEQRFAIFSNLTTRQQERARQIYERRWRQIPADRRRVLLQEFRQLRSMNQAERQQRLESADVQSQFNNEERELLAQLIAL